MNVLVGLLVLFQLDDFADYRNVHVLPKGDVRVPPVSHPVGNKRSRIQMFG